MKARSLESVEIGGRRVEYSVRASSRASKLRVRVEVGGVHVIQPFGRQESDVKAFLHANGEWLITELDRVARLQTLRRHQEMRSGEILLGGVPTRVYVEDTPLRARSNRVVRRDGELVVARGTKSPASAAKTLENWLRRQARVTIEQHLTSLRPKLKVASRKLYIMDQKTKWANCSSQRNLSFNWRVIMAPDYVLRYLVVHELVHVAVPDHSQRFWLTVQSICPDMQRSRRWLSFNAARLMVDLNQALGVKAAADHACG